ncbi:serine/threonine-protein kinase [Novipirellula artificiosorum]|uniref:Serine/threonine-protein kinase PknB n=1 Tax=Novipirellula artificiosorum TaxID=2528016 RepID=A0A5C6DWD1_9BACT|nr:serine/threonine-protein kinase [Novipirellula artificiosorum]TWU39366.1 Serine/threonine-protein kinase PknB [Novipirellula artificiosorum]
MSEDSNGPITATDHSRSETPTRALEAGMAAAFGGQDSLTTPPIHQSVLRTICSGLSNVPRVILKSGLHPEGDPIVRTKSTEIPITSPDSRYRVDGEIARGGMGAILKGHDIDLGRDLAIKVLLDSHKDKPEVIQRFIEEAQIGGQLQHPGIAPVYELGQFSDKRPYFSMKLVKGKTLSVLLSDRESPTEDRARFLAIFEQICQTMAYAHSRGVIHRDLKPSNVMVGAFGEVQVMDWGLAKVLSEGGVADERKALSAHQGTSIIETIRSHGSGDTPGLVGSQTQLGSVLGTPAYMSPEQALGEVDRLDEHADVFGLGAILCEILTGKPPYVADHSTEVFRMATRGKLADCFERLAKTGADQELSKLVHVCLEIEPADRLRDAGVVSNRISEYLETVDQRLRKAELDTITSETRATEERKRRKVVMALAASLIALITIAGGSWNWKQNQQNQIAMVAMKEREDRERIIVKELSAANALAGDLESDAKTDPELLSRALECVRRAKKLLEGNEVDPELDTQVQNLASALETRLLDQTLLAELENIWEWEMQQYVEQTEHLRRLAESGRERFPDDFFNLPPPVPRNSFCLRSLGIDGAAERYERAFSDWGLHINEEESTEFEKRISSLPEQLRECIIVSLERWQRSLDTPLPIEKSKNRNWSILMPTKVSSPGGDSLEILGDMSILASGEHPEHGYELTFETSQKVITAVRLEALTHDSLPNGGPGRSATGYFAVPGILMAVASKSDPSKRELLKLRSAVADMSSIRYPMSTMRWNSGGSGGESMTAVFETDVAVTSDSGFLFFMNTGYRTHSKVERANLGSFRLSVCSNDSNYKKSDWLSRLVSRADNDQWRRAYREVIDNDDIVEFLDLLREKDAFNRQPAIVRTDVVELMKRAEIAPKLMEILSQNEWKTTRPTMLEATSGASLKWSAESGIAVDGIMPERDEYQISFPVEPRPIRAILVETMPDSTRENSSAGRAGEGFSISDIDLSRCSGFDQGKDTNVPIADAFCSYDADQNMEIYRAFDNDSQTRWQVHDGKTKRVAVFLLDDRTPFDTDTLRVCLATGKPGMENALLGSFRIQICYDDIEIPDPADLSLGILEDACRANPGDYWASLSLARSLLHQSQIRPVLSNDAMAIRCAAAALALRPDKAVTHIAFADSLVSPLLRNAGEVSQDNIELAAYHYQKAIGLGMSTSTITDRFQAFLGEVLPASEDVRFGDSVSLVRLAEAMDPEGRRTAIFGYKAWALAYACGEDPSLEEEAFRVSKRYQELYPKHPWPWSTLGIVEYYRGNIEKAREAFDKSYEMTELNPNMELNGYDWFWMSMVMAKQGETEEAKQHYDKAVEWMGENPSEEKLLQYVRNQASRVLAIDEAK